ncbi:hypothetical protein GGR56DRAFT_669852 [Xylariaceae sp. FL0804]|nr:hypothetical protein GGR56DRAFT_669852 [Xylariaceae sp. FL0804]
MSKLSESVKALINAGHARPGYTPASSQFRPALTRFADDASGKKVGLPAWVTLSTAVSATMNCPEAMTHIFELANSRSPDRAPAATAALMREVGLKCISFNGIPRTINTLGAFRASLADDVAAALPTRPTRELTPERLPRRRRDGLALWDSVYAGFERKLLDKLARSHPDLPVHIIDGHYASVLSNPSDLQQQQQEQQPTGSEEDGEAAAEAAGAAEPVGRVLTSLVAIACLRAQTGVGPQVVSHVFGLRKAYENEAGGARAAGERPVEGGEWLAGDEGNLWLLSSIDALTSAISGGEGTTFAPGIRPKL